MTINGIFVPDQYRMLSIRYNIFEYQEKLSGAIKKHVFKNSDEMESFSRELHKKLKRGKK